MRYIVAERDPEADLPTWRVAEADAMAAESTLAEAITLSDQPPDPALADETVREDLAVALRDRQLTVGQRASKPFVFRSGGLLGASAKAWTVRDVVAYMDRHPSDGIFHLCNGTLEHWLLEEGAPHLAKLAHQAVIEGRNDRRRALEIFLIGTGLVARPRLALSPKQVNLGYILDGTSASELLRIRRGRGRGYLYGKLAAGEQWLHLSPKDFSANAADVVVTVDTTPLLIGPEPYRADVLVASSAGAEPAARAGAVSVSSPCHRPSTAGCCARWPGCCWLACWAQPSAGFSHAASDRLGCPSCRSCTRAAEHGSPLDGAGRAALGDPRRSARRDPAAGVADPFCGYPVAAPHGQVGGRIGRRSSACHLGLGPQPGS